MARKRTADEMQHMQASTNATPYAQMFDVFRQELDEHHDRRERVIKASRDITAASKKIIFALQRARKIAQPLPSHITNGTKQFYTTISDRYSSVASDLTGLNGWRYARNISGGNQEFMEAICFEHYLTTGDLITYEDACERLSRMYFPTTDNVDQMDGVSTATKVDVDMSALLSVDDYILGIYDATGELMRFAITCMATDGQLPTVQSAVKHITSDGNAAMSDHPKLFTEETSSKIADEQNADERTILTDLRRLRSLLEGLDTSNTTGYLSKDAKGKAEVMRASVEKVERAMYSLVIRGRERPKGWMPDVERSHAVDVDT